VHVAPGAVHGPHQPALDWRGRNAGRFDLGWDRYREVVYQRQLELGVIPPGTSLTSRPPELPAWDSFGPQERQLLARQMENYADFHEHTDFEIGRLIEALQLMQQFDNTLFIYILGDNGSSAEGGLTGTMNEMAAMSGLAPSIQDGLVRINEIGLPGTSPLYASGWAWAGDTPFKWMKQVASHFGGTRNGMVVTWPARIADAGGKRFQFQHVIDIAPTLLEVTGIAEPTIMNGVHQKPIEGLSLAYTFDRENAEAPSTHTTQYFEMLGNRALYRDGWMACCRHGRLPWQTSGSADFAEDRWELYDIEKDFSQAHDLAAEQPERLHALKELFLVEAARYGVLPLDDRFAERMQETSPGFFSGRERVAFPPGMVRLPEGSAPRLSNVDHTITVTAEIPETGAEGVLVCLGGDWAGWSLFVEHDHLHYHYNWHDLERYDMVSREPLPRGELKLRVEFRCDDPRTRGGPATLRLFCNERRIGEGRIEHQVRGRFGECLDIGEDSLSPVYPGYRERLPFRFTGRIESVVFDIDFDETAQLSRGELLEEQLRAD
jgi:arylsulfatase